MQDGAKHAKDFTWLRWQKSVIFACGMEIRDRLIG